LNRLGCLGLDELVLPVQHVKFFEPTVKLQHNKNQREDTDHHSHAPQIDRKVTHAPILIVIEFYDKRL